MFINSDLTAITFDVGEGFKGMQHRPWAAARHPIFGSVHLYDWRDERIHMTGIGAECRFYDNNARPGKPTHYGLKVYHDDDLFRAWATCQRQRLAHERRLAPPVHRMIYVRTNEGAKWGYQTSLARLVRKADEYGSYGGAKTPRERALVRHVRKHLSRVDIRGTQHDYGPLGKMRNDTAQIISDLHIGNVGRYRGQPVCIDFGWCSVGNHYEEE